MPYRLYWEEPDLTQLLVRWDAPRFRPTTWRVCHHGDKARFCEGGAGTGSIPGRVLTAEPQRHAWRSGHQRKKLFYLSGNRTRGAHGEGQESYHFATPAEHALILTLSVLLRSILESNREPRLTTFYSGCMNVEAIDKLGQVSSTFHLELHRRQCENESQSLAALDNTPPTSCPG